MKTEDQEFQPLFQALLREAERPPHPRDVARARFWYRVWAAADASRAYRKAAAEWREAGSVDVAGQLEAAADAHDAAWDQRIRAHHDAR